VGWWLAFFDALVGGHACLVRPRETASPSPSPLLHQSNTAAWPGGGGGGVKTDSRVELWRPRGGTNFGYYSVLFSQSFQVSFHSLLIIAFLLVCLLYHLILVLIIACLLCLYHLILVILIACFVCLQQKGRLCLVLVSKFVWQDHKANSHQ
jgi:hypothetical protein